MTDISWGEVRVEIVSIITDAVEGFTEDLDQDIHGFAMEISKDVVEAMKHDRDDLLQALRDQAKVLAEVYRLRLNQISFDVLGEILVIVVRTARKVLTLL